MLHRLTSVAITNLISFMNRRQTVSVKITSSSVELTHYVFAGIFFFSIVDFLSTLTNNIGVQIKSLITLIIDRKVVYTCKPCDLTERAITLITCLRDTLQGTVIVYSCNM